MNILQTFLRNQSTHQKLKIPTKRAGRLLLELNNEAKQEFNVPEFSPGDMVEVKMTVSKTTGRYNITRGVVLAKRNRGFGSSFTIRNHKAGMGFEKTFPLYCPMMEHFKVLEKAFIHKGLKRVRRAKLYYLRDKPARFTTWK